MVGMATSKFWVNSSKVLAKYSQRSQMMEDSKIQAMIIDSKTLTNIIKAKRRPFCVGPRTDKCQKHATFNAKHMRWLLVHFQNVLTRLLEVGISNVCFITRVLVGDKVTSSY